jgi:AAHS family 4-hydroxybenzoate transporter-like MFS transporter
MSQQAPGSGGQQAFQLPAGHDPQSHRAADRSGPAAPLGTRPASDPIERVNVSDCIDTSRIGTLQTATFVLCLLCLIMDGFDVQALGYVAPAIVRDWNIASATLGPVFGAGNLGVLIGALGFSMLADRIGRRPALIAATLFFSAMTLLTARAGSVQQLLLLRFISGIGLGGIIPNATALVGEYSPRRARITLTMAITVGFTAGAAIGGFVAAALIPAFGWQSVFYFGGAVPLVIALAMFFWLPESLQFMVLRGAPSERIRARLVRIDPSAPTGSAVEYVVHEKKLKGAPVAHLFRDGRAPATILFWIVNFMNLLNLYALSSWLPTVVREAGHSTSTAVLVGTVLQVGGTIGTFGLAWLVARQGFVSMLAASFAVASLSIAAIGQGLALPTLFVVVFIAGWCVVGSQPGINAFEAEYYPTHLRSTGIGWALGIGRAGAILGPVLGGIAMGLNWSTRDIFLAAAVPALISVTAMLAMRWAMPSPGR